MVFFKKSLLVDWVLSKGMPVICLLLVALCLASCKQKSTSDHQLSSGKKTPKAVFIIVDGIAADVIEKLNPPALAAISKTGGYTRAYVGGEKGTYTETPTISAVGYNSLLTSTWVNKHNVWDNDIADPNYHYHTIFRIAEAYNPRLKTAVFSTWTDNRTKLLGAGLPQTENLKLDYKFDGLELDTVRYPHDDNADYIHQIDEAVAEEAARYIAETGPDLSWVYLQYTDDMGHRFGDSEKFYDAIRMADKQVGKVWDAIEARERQFDEDWLIIVTTDHGRDSISGKHHGGQSPREKLSWIVTNVDSLNAHFSQTPGVVDIMPSIANHLGIRIPDDVGKEIDGVPFIGNADFVDLKAKKRNEKIFLRWTSLSHNDDSKAEVFITETNQFKTGGKDTYRKIGDVAISAEAFVVDDPGNGTFFKILLKGPNHYVNAWIVDKEISSRR